MHRQIAGKLTGRVTKWFVLAFWIIAVIGLGSLRGQAHRGAEQRGVLLAARATRSRRKALDKLAPFQDPNAIPTTVVYSKKSGLIRSDLAATEAAGRPSCRRWTTSRAR